LKVDENTPCTKLGGKVGGQEKVLQRFQPKGGEKRRSTQLKKEEKKKDKLKGKRGRGQEKKVSQRGK